MLQKSHCSKGVSIAQSSTKSESNLIRYASPTLSEKTGVQNSVTHPVIVYSSEPLFISIRPSFYIIVKPLYNSTGIKHINTDIQCDLSSLNEYLFDILFLTIF